MQSVKGSQQYKFDHFDVIITPFSQKKLQITVIDPFQKMEFCQKVLTLNYIGTTTLLKALQRKMIQIKMDMKVNKTSESAILQIDVLVASQFLKPVQQTIYLKKTRDISQSQILKNSVNVLSSKIKIIKDSDKIGSNLVRVGTVQQQQKSYHNNNATFDTIAQIKLPKGKYVLTLSYLVKATNQWMYIYFGQGQQCIQNYGFYVPVTTNFIPIVIRKTHNIASQSQNVQFTTYCTQSYPVILKDVILTAQQIQ